MIAYCRNLKFEETPDYKYLVDLLGEAFRRQNYEFDFKYDWTGTNDMTESSTRGILGTDYSKHILHPNKKAFSGNTNEEVYFKGII